MGVPYSGDAMTSHLQYITVRNDRGAEMLAALGDKLVRAPTVDKGDRRALVMQVGGGGGSRGEVQLTALHTMLGA